MSDLRIGRRLGAGILTLGLAVVLVACGSAADPDTTVTPNIGDWALSLFISIGSIVAGFLLGTAVFA